MLRGKSLWFGHKVMGNLALKKEPTFLKVVNNRPTISLVKDTKEISSTPKILTLKIKRENRIYCGCWQLNGDDDC